jgi:hypothetical protein
MSQLSKLFSFALLVSFSGLSQAALVDYITITSSANTYIQISEVVALDKHGQDQALTDSATINVHSVLSGGDFSADYAIDGIFNHTYWKGYYHSENSTNEYVTIDFNGVVELSSIKIYGRDTVECSPYCDSRDVYDLAVYGAGGLLLNYSSLSANNVDNYAHVDLPASPVPLPAAVWLFGSSLLGLMGFSRCKKSEADA